MTLQDWLKQFENYSEEMLQKEVLIEAPNGLLFKPEIKFKLKNSYDMLNHSPENIESIIINY